MSQIDQSKQEVFKYCKAMLGDGMIDVELDPIHYETALNRALGVFRQRSDNAVEESYAFLTLREKISKNIFCPKKSNRCDRYFVDQWDQEVVMAQVAQCLSHSTWPIPTPIC